MTNYLQKNVSKGQSFMNCAQVKFPNLQYLLEKFVSNVCLIINICLDI